MLTLFVSCLGGRETPLLCCRCPFLRRNGYGLRPPSGRCSRERTMRTPFLASLRKGWALPPKPPIPSPARFYRGKSQEYEATPPQKTSGVRTVCFLHIEIICKFCVSRPWNIFSLKRCAFQTIRPVVSRKKRGFPPTSGRAALSRRRAFCRFQKQNARKASVRNTAHAASPKYSAGADLPQVHRPWPK